MVKGKYDSLTSGSYKFLQRKTGISGLSDAMLNAASYADVSLPQSKSLLLEASPKGRGKVCVQATCIKHEVCILCVLATKNTQ